MVRRRWYDNEIAASRALGHTGAMRRSLVLAALVAAATTAAPASALACPGSPDPCPYRAFQQFGTTNGVLSFPESIAVAPDGSLLVPDGFDYKVSRFSNAGQFLTSYGTPDLVTPPVDGTSSGASGIAVDPATGNYYVLDASNNRVEEFSPAGTILHRAGKADGTSGALVGEFNLDGGSGKGGGIAVANGFVYVADGGNQRIQRLSLTLTGATTMSGAAFVGNPQGIQVSSGALWVTDHQSPATNTTVARYSLSGTALSSPVTATVSGAAGLAYNAASNALYVGTFQIEKLNATTMATPTAVIVPAGHGPGQTNEPEALVLLPGGDLAVAQGDDTVKRFTPAGAQVWAAGINEHANGTVPSAEGLSVTQNGDVLVASEIAEQITRFNSAGAFVSRFASNFNDPAGSWLPASVAQGIDGSLWVGDVGGRILHFGADGTYIADASQDLSHADVAIDGHGQIDELRFASASVRRFDAAGNLLGSFGSSGSGPGQMLNPEGIAAGPDGTIAIADTGNDRVDLFAADGTFVRSFGSVGNAPGQFQILTGVALDGHGHVFTLDLQLNRVQEFDAQFGGFIAMWGGLGPGDGQFFEPQSIAADAAGNVYVGDGLQRRVQEFVLAPPPTPPPPAAPLPIPPITPAKAAKLKVSVTSRVRLSTLRNKGLSIGLTSDQPGKATLTLTLGPSDAHKLGLRAAAATAKPKGSTKPVTIGSAASTYIAPRKRTIALKLRLLAKAKLRHLVLKRHQSKKLTLTISFKTTGRKTTTVHKTIKLER
jgi:tripartite motif-containing protein 71